MMLDFAHAWTLQGSRAACGKGARFSTRCHDEEMVELSAAEYAGEQCPGRLASRFVAGLRHDLRFVPRLTYPFVLAPKARLQGFSPWARVRR
jgi:hypothetical protein